VRACSAAVKPVSSAASEGAIAALYTDSSPQKSTANRNSEDAVSASRRCRLRNTTCATYRGAVVVVCRLCVGQGVAVVVVVVAVVPDDSSGGVSGGE
jgi:hypothetical protein